MDQEKIGQFIKKLRKDNHLSQQEFAKRLGVSFQAVSKWENGKNMPDISTLKEIKKQFHVPIDEILGGVEAKDSHNKKYWFLVIFLTLIIMGLIIFILFYFKSTNQLNNKFKFNEVTSTNTDFKVSGNVVKTNDRTSLIINRVFYTKEDENIKYSELNCNLYEEKENKKNKITTCDNGYDLTLSEYLQNLKIRMDHYTENCPMFTETKMYIEINAQSNNKTVIYKIPIEIDDTDCD